MAKVLVIGNGGREHALAYKFSHSPQVSEVFVAPGNPGMKDVATLVEINQLDFCSLIQFVKKNKIDLTFVGPEIPLCHGIVDAFEKEGLTIFGPTQAAARLEGSKVFSKAMMKKYQIPTAAYESFSDYNLALAYLSKQKMPIVLKADGLAAGKGVIIAQTLQEAQTSLKEMMCEGLFDQAGNQVVIEEFLEGEEFSLLAFVHGETIIPMEIAQDHKRAFDHDQGLNTGGMGAYTPVSHLPNQAKVDALNQIIRPMAKAMIQEGCPFSGILYGGCMWTGQSVKTIEYNVRFGDPETEVLMLSLESDLYQVCLDVLAGKQTELRWSKNAVLGTVLASTGYPESSTVNAVIEGLDKVASDVVLFHMSTAIQNNQFVTAGGRVLFVASSQPTLALAKAAVYQAIGKIDCDSLFWRTDIGSRGLV